MIGQPVPLSKRSFETNKNFTFLFFWLIWTIVLEHSHTIWALEIGNIISFGDIY